MTEAQKDILLMLANVYLEVGRPKRALMILMPLAKLEPNNVPLGRIALQAYLKLGDFERSIGIVDRLVEHEFSSAELAFALAMQSRALSGLGRKEAAELAWMECVALCRVSDLDVMEYAI